MAADYPCPCCGHLVFGQPPGSYGICPICFWEDDALQLEFATTLTGGANVLTLVQAQRNYTELGASERRLLPHVRPPEPGEGRDPAWRPIDPDRDSFPSFSDPAAARAPEHDERLYYWRPSFWRRAATI